MKPKKIKGTTLAALIEKFNKLTAEVSACTPMSTKVIVATYWFASSSGSGKYETLAYADGTTSCGCMGWTRRIDANGNRSCKHTRMVEAGQGPANAESYHVAADAPKMVPASPVRVTPTKAPTKPGQRKFLD